MTDPVAAGADDQPADAGLNWDLTARIAKTFAGSEPLARSYLAEGLEEDFEELTETAEKLVTDFTGLESLQGPANCMVIDRPEWISANISTFRRMLRPLTDRLAQTSPEGLPADGLAAGIVRFTRDGARTVVSLEMGAMLGFLARRVLGQYDLFLPEDAGDAVYYVGPNVLGLEKRFDFPPREFRLWIALHELTHRAQFTGVPWLKPYFISLVEQTFSAADPDPRRLVEALRRTVEALLRGDDPLADGGVPALLASPEQRQVLEKVQALMCLLEGHGNFVMDRLGEDLIPQAEKMSETLRARRAVSGLQRFVFRAIGLEMKVQQYELGERFVATVQEIGGGSAIDSAWTNVEALPTMDEIRDPPLWLSRVA